MLVFSAPEVGRDRKARRRKPRDNAASYFFKAPNGATSANSTASLTEFQARAVPLFQSLDVHLLNLNLRLTPPG
jgi:hypothetical protein